MKLEKTIHQRTTVIDKIYCNKCAKELYNDNIEDSSLPYESFIASFGFGSKNDGTIYRFDLCEKCFIRLIERFKIHPDIDPLGGFE